MATIRVEAFRDKPAAELQKAKLELRGFFVAGPEPADDIGWDGTQAGGSADNVFSGGPASLWVIFAKK